MGQDDTEHGRLTDEHQGYEMDQNHTDNLLALLIGIIHKQGGRILLTEKDLDELPQQVSVKTYFHDKVDNTLVVELDYHA